MILVEEALTWRPGRRFTSRCRQFQGYHFPLVAKLRLGE